MSILITGGAGLIGSHTAKLMSEVGQQVVVLDNLSTGSRDNVRWGSFVQSDICDAALVRQVIQQHAVTAVMHLAASAQVGDSMRQPGAYFANNIRGSLSLLDAMVAEGVRNLVFASSCSVYGNAASIAAQEEDATTPVSPYGESKLAIEKMLPRYEQAYGLQWVALRYFNAAGAEDGLGTDSSSNLRLIPRAVHAALGTGPALQVFGTDFHTADGSAVRDYVHVSDVARANLQALHYTQTKAPGAVINIGSGSGTSVLQIIEAIRAHAGSDVRFRYVPHEPVIRLTPFQTLSGASSVALDSVFVHTREHCHFHPAILPHEGSSLLSGCMNAEALALATGIVASLSQ